MLCGAALQMIGGMITWTATRVEMDEIMIHGRVRRSDFDMNVQNEEELKSKTVQEV